MSNTERYNFSNEVKQQAVEEAHEEGVVGHLNVHHIIPKWFANKYHLDPEIIKSRDNAIALEVDTFHPWIHGKHICKEDDQADWRGFDEADYIELAIKLYGFDQELFQPRRNNKVIYQSQHRYSR